MHSDSKKRRSFLAMLFAAGDVRRKRPLMSLIPVPIALIMMSDRETSLQLRMVWPEHLLDDPPCVQLPPGCSIRTYQRGDEPRFFRLMELAGWEGWDYDVLQPSLAKILPDGWFMAIHDSSNEIVATAMALHNYTGRYPFWGDLGWLASDPAHAGKGLGLAVSSAVTCRLINAGYRNIQLFTEDYRLPALKTYLRLGYLPSLYAPAMAKRWRAVCAKLQWPYAPDEWREAAPLAA